MKMDDGGTFWVRPRDRNALSGASNVYEGIGIIFMGLVLMLLSWGEYGSWIIVTGFVLFGVCLVLYGSFLVVRYDDDGNRRNPPPEVAAKESPPGYYVRESHQGKVQEYTPMEPDPRATPRGQPAVLDMPRTYPPHVYSKEEPGKCVECGGTLFIGRTNCPHCGTPVS